MKANKIVSTILVLLLSGVAQSNGASSVAFYVQSQDVIRWNSEIGLEISQTRARTQIFGENGFEWLLLFPFKIENAVQLTSQSKIILRVVRLRDDGYEYAFMAELEKRHSGWKITAPLHDKEVTKEGEKWIDSISVPYNEPEALIVLVAGFGEWSGGKRDVDREWRYWDFDACRLGKPFFGQVLPEKVLE